jgi:hypothetical protein
MSQRDVNGVPECERCAAPVDDGATICWACGDQIAPREPAHETTETAAQDQISIVDWKEPDPTALTVQPRHTIPTTQTKTWPPALVGGAGVLACVTALIVLQSLQPAASPQPLEEGTPPPAPVAAAPVVEAAPAPTWVGNRQAAWANDGSKTISFELKATSDVNVWMSRVRLLLVVRCLYRTTEVFVAINSAASIEGQSGSHTVHLNIDSDPELVQRWTDSVTGQELFAPDSVALARRLAGAERLRFSFTPYNAKPVTAEFSVTGFEKLAVLVGNTCGWKLDDARTAQVRPARLNQARASVP